MKFFVGKSSHRINRVLSGQQLEQRASQLLYLGSVSLDLHSIRQLSVAGGDDTGRTFDRHDT
jgi:hypothetical protein